MHFFISGQLTKQKTIEDISDTFLRFLIDQLINFIVNKEKPLNFLEEIKKIIVDYLFLFLSYISIMSNITSRKRCWLNLDRLSKEASFYYHCYW